MPASAAVCEEAARAPAAVRPAFTTKIGLWRVSLRASWKKRRASPKPSRYMRITRMAASSAQYSSRSFPDTSALLPTETNWWIPMPSSSA